MEEFWRLIIQEEYYAVRQPPIEANNFELKPTLITMVQQHQFTSHPSKGPNEHLGRFMRMENTVKLNGVRPDVIKLQLFPFSLSRFKRFSSKGRMRVSTQHGRGSRDF